MKLLRCGPNDHKDQDGNAANTVNKLASFISYLSRSISFKAGAIISKGTSAGVGLGREPPVFMSRGGYVELGIGELEVQRRLVVYAE